MNRFKNIQKAEVSPYLFTKIQQKIRTKSEENIPIKWAWTAIASLALIFIVDLAVLSSSTPAAQSDEFIPLMPNNSLYHE